MTRRDAVGLGLLLGAAALALRPLADFWSANANYAYGWGVPFLVAYLLFERWRCRPDPMSFRSDLRATSGLTWVAVAWAGAFLAVRLVIETEPASRPLLWWDASLAAAVLLAWFGLLGGRPWVRHFAFPVVFLLVGVPWIFRCEFFLTQGLMRLNATWVADTLALLDVPARATGNTIVLATGQLGVTDACSGIRSLQAALMMGLFFGEFYRFGVRGRTALLGAGAGLALLGNYARMLFLAWRGARDGLASVEAVHDSAGFFILGFTVISLWLICLVTRSAGSTRGDEPREIAAPARRLAWRWAVTVFAATLLAESATQGWYGWRQKSAPRFSAWTVAWPSAAAGFRTEPLPAAAHDELHDEASSAAEWRGTQGWRWSGLWIRYQADAAGKVVFESHNPALCLPAAGWRTLPGGGSFALEIAGVHLAVQGRVFRMSGTTEYVFWVPYLDRGRAAGADAGRGLYGHTLAALLHGRCPWLVDAWNGCRGAEAETLEVAVSGPMDYAEAERAFRRETADWIQREDAMVARPLASNRR